MQPVPIVCYVCCAGQAACAYVSLCVPCRVGRAYLSPCVSCRAACACVSLCVSCRAACAYVRLCVSCRAACAYVRRAMRPVPTCAHRERAKYYCLCVQERGNFSPWDRSMFCSKSLEEAGAVCYASSHSKHRSTKRAHVHNQK